ncbi:hypothetical protein [Shewanella glacialipiscicola]|uniref:DUF2269 family protein n=1 Tax=Shewanella glacialipiscicola TaxID=614069 RepID=A0ABQ6J0T3_9GAMM|nr:hypothetical protein [Shewanella glacialipiscicola]MCL1086129.1 hypothetical protein [Shewanella glacialipiscicola]MCU7996382.1 hypothetical protein [Shewanella glacialipiscicola]MCU8027695.1 hypothetical protein [Shewanella glacialipiscicola]GIU16655.1 hypothetical protein TUM4636_30170 [Shewanella glacialipiscicola]GMA80900.1 hypothetical protein GCM10025855_04330 [Shewanella glacialipiscicola]
MTDSIKNTMNLLKFLHWLGVLMLVCGLGLYMLTQWSLDISGMLVIASLIGLGLVLMSPYPVVLFIQWAKRQDDIGK